MLTLKPHIHVTRDNSENITGGGHSAFTNLPEGTQILHYEFVILLHNSTLYSLMKYTLILKLSKNANPPPTPVMFSE